MVASAPSLPNCREAVKEYLKGKTNAGNRVATPGTSGRRPSTPRHIVSHEGSIGQFDTAIDMARIVIDTYGTTPEEAWYVASQARDTMLPPERGPWGLYAQVTYEDPADKQRRTVTLSGAQLESGPREDPENRSRVITQYLVTCF